MSTVFSLPNESDLTQMMAMLYGDSMSVKPGNAIDASENNPVAVYIDDEGVPVAACVCDSAFGAYAGSALTMIPPGGANDAAKSGELSGAMMDNLGEIMNILSRLFMVGKTPHMKLDTVYPNSQKLPDNVKHMLDSVKGKVGFDVNFDRYGTGIVALLST